MPCMRCCRARCVFSPKLGIIIQDFARQLFDQLLAEQAILMAGGAVLTLPPPAQQTMNSLAIFCR